MRDARGRLGRKSTSPGDSQDGRTQLGNESAQFDTLIHLQHLQTNHSPALHESPAAQNDDNSPWMRYNKRHAIHRHNRQTKVNVTIYHNGQTRIDNTLQMNNATLKITYYHYTPSLHTLHAAPICSYVHTKQPCTI